MTHQAIKNLVYLRHVARMQVALRESNRALLKEAKAAKPIAIARGNRLAEARAKISIEYAMQSAVEIKFALIQTGQWLVHVAAECEKLPRGDWLRALKVNESEWFTPAMLEDGEHLHEVVVGLRLENSATPDTGSLSRPLACCFQMALHNAVKTDQVLAKSAHDQVNEIFGDRFGEWVEPTTLQRLGMAA